MRIITQSCIYSPLGVVQKVSTRLVRYLGLLLIPLMSLLASNAFADASGTSEGMSWTYTSSTKTFKITGTGYLFDNPCSSYDVDTLIVEGTGDGISIDFYVFGNSSFVKVSLSNVNLESNAFSDCTSLTTVTMPNVSDIGMLVFSGCSNLSTAYVSATARIGDDAFPSTTNVVKMTRIDATDEATCDKSGHSAVGWYSEDNTVYINDKYEVLDAKDYLTSKTTTISIDDNLTGYYNECTKTFKITGEGYLYGNPCGSYDVDTLIIEGTGYGISFEFYVFDNSSFENSSFVKVSLSGVNNIMFYAFSGCPSLTTVTMSDVDDIGNDAFSGCTSLTTVTMLDVATISSSAFNGCTNLSTAYVSATASIDDDVFPSTTNVVKMTRFDATDEATCDKPGHSAVGWYSEDNTVYINDKYEVLDAWNLTTKTTTISIDDNLTGYYNECTKTFKITGTGTLSSNPCGSYDVDTLIIEGTGDGISLNSMVFANSSFKKVSLSDVGNIVNLAFYGCTSLTTVTMSDVDNIQSRAFYGCTSLTTVTMSDVDNIRFNAFSNCISLTTVNLSDVDNIEFYAFDGCTNLSTAYVSATASIDFNAFPSTTNVVKMTHFDATDEATCDKPGHSAIGWYSEDNTVYINDKNEVLDAKDYLTTKETQSVSLGGNLTGYYNECTKTFKITGDGIISDNPCSSYDVDTLIIEGSGLNIIINDNIFRESSFKKVSLSGITRSGRTAFSDCTSLTTVTMSNVGNSGYYAFSGCTSLTTVTLSDVEAVQPGAFERCSSLTKVPMSNVDNVMDGAFSDCTSLTTITMLDVEIIGADAFSGCTNLSTAYVSADALIIKSAFPSTTNVVKMTHYDVDEAGDCTYGHSAAGWYSEDNTVYINDKYEVKDAADYLIKPLRSGSCGTDLTWAYSCDGTLTITGTGAMTDYSGSTIPWGSFSDDVKKVVFSGSDITICKKAFENCSNLASADLSGVKSIGTEAFRSCEALTSVTLTAVDTIKDGVFAECANLTTIDLSGVTVIENGAFNSCASLKDIDLSGVTKIGQIAFAYCSGLTELDLSSVDTVEYGAFYNCSNISNTIYLPNAKVIEESAFEECEKLSLIYVSDKATTDESSFDKADVVKLTNYKVDAATPCTYGHSAAGWYSADDVVYINDKNEVKDAADYLIEKSASGNYNDKFTWTYSCEDSTLTIDVLSELTDVTYGNGPWSDLGKQIKSLKISGTDVKIGDDMFAECSALTSVSLSGVTEIGGTAFYNCSALTSVNLADVTTIDAYAFSQCTALQSVYVPNAETISADAFADCSALSVAYVSKDATIATSAFPSTTTIVNLDSHDALAATCTTGGYKETGWYSTDDKVFIDESYEVKDAKDYILPVDATAHNWGAWDTVKVATCTEKGMAVRICQYDETHKDTVIIDALGHDFSDKILSATPNAEGLYAYVCKNDPNDLTEYNIIKGETDDQNIELTKDKDGNYSVDALNIKDTQSLNIPVNFTAGTLSYSRIADKDTITFVLPFDVPADAINGQVYQLKSFDGKTLTYSKATDGAKANTPYLLLVNVKGENMISEVSDVTVKANAKTDTLTADNASQFGSYNSVTLTSDASKVYYAFQDNKFYRGNEVTVNPFRTAIVLDKTTAANGNPAPSYALKGINVVFEDSDVTGAELVNADNALTGKVNVYDVLGRAVRINVDAETCLNGLSNGVYMVNGHKFVVRNK